MKAQRIRIILTFVSSVGLALLVAACAGPRGGGADAAEGGARMAPPFELTDLEGQTISLADSDGQVRLVDFWATWCAPCREEIPMFNELQEAYGDKGFTILAVSDEGPDVQRPFAEEYGLRYTSLVGTEQIGADYGVLSLPTAYLIDREGRIVDHFIGPKPRRMLERKIRELLDLPPSGA